MHCAKSYNYLFALNGTELVEFLAKYTGSHYLTEDKLHFQPSKPCTLYPPERTNMTTHTFTITRNDAIKLAALRHAVDQERHSAVLATVGITIQKSEFGPELVACATCGKALVERTIPMHESCRDNWLTVPSVGPHKGETLRLSDPGDPDALQLDDGTLCLPVEFLKEMEKLAKLKSSDDPEEAFRIVVETRMTVHAERKDGEQGTRHELPSFNKRYPPYKAALDCFADSGEPCHKQGILAFNPALLERIYMAASWPKETKRHPGVSLRIIPHGSGRGMEIRPILSSYAQGLRCLLMPIIT